jgi:hypothetical protein
VTWSWPVWSPACDAYAASAGDGADWLSVDVGSGATAFTLPNTPMCRVPGSAGSGDEGVRRDDEVSLRCKSFVRHVEE